MECIGRRDFTRRAVMYLIGRRGFLFAAAAAVSPMSAEAESTKSAYRIGFIAYYSTSSGLDIFRKTLKELGYVEGKNLVIETRSAKGQADRLPGIIAELIDLKVDVLLAASTPTALAAMQATTTIPIVFASVFDPVGSGIVPNLARPGGNVTGAAIGVGGGVGLGEKWLQLLKEVAPSISHVAALVNPANPASAASLLEVATAARALKVRLDALDAETATKLDKALSDISHGGAQGLIVTNDPLFTPHAARLVEFAARRRLPAMYFFDLFADAGGLMAFGASPEDSYRRAANYIDKIFRGVKPGDLPVEQPTLFRLTINLRTAKALGISVPDSILVRADKVIE